MFRRLFLVLPLFDPKVMQSTSRFHHGVRDALLGVPQHIFHDAAAFHSSEVMLHAHANARQLPVRLLLSGREFASGWLFFSPGTSALLLARPLETPRLCTVLSPA